MEFVLIFDIPTKLGSVKRQTDRLLVRSGAKQIQRSVWKSKELSDFIGVASFVKKSGGAARILEERFVF